MRNPGYSFSFIINQDAMKPSLYRSYIAGSPFHLQCIYKDTVCYLTPLVYFITDDSSPSSSAPYMGIYSSRYFCVRVSDRF